MTKQHIIITLLLLLVSSNFFASQTTSRKKEVLETAHDLLWAVENLNPDSFSQKIQSFKDARNKFSWTERFFGHHQWPFTNRKSDEQVAGDLVEVIYDKHLHVAFRSFLYSAQEIEKTEVTGYHMLQTLIKEFGLDNVKPHIPAPYHKHQTFGFMIPQTEPSPVNSAIDKFKEMAAVSVLKKYITQK